MGHKMTHRSASTRIVGGALAVVVVAMLTGCFANPLDAIVENATEETAKNAAEDMIEGMTGGEADLSIGSIPDSFPSEIPLVSDNVLQGMEIPEGIMVVLSDPRSVDELAAQVKEDFSGWEELGWTDLDMLVGGVYQQDASYTVTVSIMAEEGSDAIVSYTVNTSPDE